LIGAHEPAVEVIDRLVGDEHRFEHNIQPSQRLGNLAHDSSDLDSARERPSKSMRLIIATAAGERMINLSSCDPRHPAAPRMKRRGPAPRVGLYAERAF